MQLNQLDGPTTSLKVIPIYNSGNHLFHTVGACLMCGLVCLANQRTDLSNKSYTITKKWSIFSVIFRYLNFTFQRPSFNCAEPV